MNLNVLPCILPAELDREMVLPAGRMAARLPAAVQGFNARTLARGILSLTLSLRFAAERGSSLWWCQDAARLALGIGF